MLLFLCIYLVGNKAWISDGRGLWFGKGDKKACYLTPSLPSGLHVNQPVWQENMNCG